MSAGDAASDGLFYVSDLMGGAKNLLIGNVSRYSSSIFVTGRLVQPPALPDYRNGPDVAGLLARFSSAEKKVELE